MEIKDFFSKEIASNSENVADVIIDTKNDPSIDRQLNKILRREENKKKPKDNLPIGYPTKSYGVINVVTNPYIEKQIDTEEYEPTKDLSKNKINKNSYTRVIPEIVNTERPIDDKKYIDFYRYKNGITNKRADKFINDIINIRHKEGLNKTTKNNDIINTPSMPEKNEPKIESPEKSTLSAEDLKLQQDIFESTTRYGAYLLSNLATNRKNPKFKNDLENFNKNPYESVRIDLNKKIYDDGVKALGSEKIQGEREKILNNILGYKMTLDNLNKAIEKNIPLKKIIEINIRRKEGSALNERDEIIKKIGQMLRQGIDKVVIHGQTSENGDEVRIKPEFGENIDTDTRGALYFLSLAKGVKYNEGSYTQLGFKGSKVDNEEPTIPNDRKQEKGDTTLYIDTSGENLSFKIGIDGKEIFIDHHHKYDDQNNTSATELVYEILTKNKMMRTEPWMENMVNFVTNIDNLSYANDKRYNLEFLKNKWPESIIGIYKNVPFSKITQWFKEGRDPFKPEFTETDLNEMLPRVELGKDAEGNVIKKMSETKLLDIINEKKREIGADISNAKLAIELMEARGIKLENERLGKVLYNLQDRQQEIKDMGTGRNPVNKIYNGFLVTKALSLDSYVTYQNKYNRFMINTNTYNLRPIYEEIKKIVPETVLVRGVMLMQPQGLSNRKDITEDKFLNLLGLKNEVEKSDMQAEQINDFEKSMKEIKLKKEKVEKMKAKEEEFKNLLKTIKDAESSSQNKITQNRSQEYIDFEEIKN